MGFQRHWTFFEDRRLSWWRLSCLCSSDCRLPGWKVGQRQQTSLQWPCPAVVGMGQRSVSTWARRYQKTARKQRCGLHRWRMPSDGSHLMESSGSQQWFWCRRGWWYRRKSGCQSRGSHLQPESWMCLHRPSAAQVQSHRRVDGFGWGRRREG